MPIDRFHEPLDAKELGDLVDDLRVTRKELKDVMNLAMRLTDRCVEILILIGNLVQPKP